MKINLEWQCLVRAKGHVGCGVERRLGVFQVLASDSGYLYARRFKLHGADVYPARLTVTAQVAISELRAEGSTGRYGHWKCKLRICKK
ncbi:hypothetical protein EVAR_66056_1 [Eumeta japonica]|uniref:Uncharacterized protein n=1 Tax=Eumeta variegata TaxID=151549 RepID=A0A4C1ZJX1_EUMVA|nr:hypothetical protein EVAR_66056_1 [Eumeta japonica]